MASMGGRVQRIAGLAAAAARTRTAHLDDICGLDGRLLEQRVEQQHVVPESEGGTQTVPVHPSRHRMMPLPFLSVAIPANSRARCDRRIQSKRTVPPKAV